MGVGDDLAWVMAGGESGAGELVKAELLGRGDLDGAIQRCTDRDPAVRACGIVGGHRLDEHGRDTPRVAVGASVGDAGDELKRTGWRGRSSKGYPLTPTLSSYGNTPTN